MMMIPSIYLGWELRSQPEDEIIHGRVDCIIIITQVGGMWKAGEIESRR
jgi:hypothetical protein